jgi:predicted AAA+ superfamily ATPase
MAFDADEKSASGVLPRGRDAGRDWFIDACLRGTYPEVCVSDKIVREQWYSEYLRTHIERDVRSHSSIHLLRDFERFIQVCASRCSQLVNYTVMAGELGVDVNTVRNWLSVLEASRIVYVLPPYFRNLAKRVIKAPKLYFTDCALVCHLTGISDEKALFEGPLAGPLFENFCVQETLKGSSKGRPCPSIPWNSN